MDNRQLAIEVFLAGVESVKPDNLINKYVSVRDGVLMIDEISFSDSGIRNIYVVGAGKASALMGAALESILGDRISGGHIVTKYGHAVSLNQIGITEAGHPVPDENGIRATEKILSMVDRAGKDDLVICLISGGGSALLTDVPDGCTLEDVKSVTETLLKAGANITEINCIRKHLSRVKGGLLSYAAYPAKVVSLILSDVIGDPLDVIASGPTAPDPTTFSDAIGIIEKYAIEDDIPQRIMKVLREGVGGNRPETLKETDKALLNTNNMVIGTNKLALSTAMDTAKSFGYETKIISGELSGDIVDAANFIFNQILMLRDGRIGGRSCLLFGGEPTVKMTGEGLGGRNQHLALLVAQMLQEMKGVTFLSAGTDGTDGPTDAAGAVVDCFTTQRAEDLNLNLESYIRNFDSYNFFKKEGGLIITGPTQTNVMDIMVALIDK